MVKDKIMKRYISLTTICLVFLSGSTKDSIQNQASRMTEQQLDSMSKPSGPYHVVINFSDMKNHMDSLNTQVLRLLNETAMASQKRDSLTQTLVSILSENMALRASNEAQKKEIDIMTKAPTIFFYFLLMIVATFVSQGLYKGIHNYRRNRTYE